MWRYEILEGVWTQKKASRKRMKRGEKERHRSREERVQTHRINVSMYQPFQSTRRRCDFSIHGQEMEKNWNTFTLAQMKNQQPHWLRNKTIKNALMCAMYTGIGFGSFFFVLNFVCPNGMSYHNVVSVTKLVIALCEQIAQRSQANRISRTKLMFKLNQISEKEKNYKLQGKKFKMS